MNELYSASDAIVYRNSVILSNVGEEIEDYSEMKVQSSINYSAYLFDRLKRNLWVNIKMQAHEKRQSCMNVFCILCLFFTSANQWLLVGFVDRASSDKWGGVV